MLSARPRADHRLPQCLLRDPLRRPRIVSRRSGGLTSTSARGQQVGQGAPGTARPNQKEPAAGWEGGGPDPLPHRRSSAARTWPRKTSRLTLPGRIDRSRYGPAAHPSSGCCPFDAHKPSFTTTGSVALSTVISSACLRGTGRSAPSRPPTGRGLSGSAGRHAAPCLGPSRRPPGRRCGRRLLERLDAQRGQPLLLLCDGAMVVRVLGGSGLVPRHLVGIWS